MVFWHHFERSDDDRNAVVQPVQLQLRISEHPLALRLARSLPLLLTAVGSISACHGSGTAADTSPGELVLLDDVLAPSEPPELWADGAGELLLVAWEWDFDSGFESFEAETIELWPVATHSEASGAVEVSIRGLSGSSPQVEYWVYVAIGGTGLPLGSPVLHGACSATEETSGCAVSDDGLVELRLSAASERQMYVVLQAEWATAIGPERPPLSRASWVFVVEKN